MSLKKIIESIKKYDNFLITSHTSPEGDALGAQLGFYNIIRKMGKRGVIVDQDILPYGFDFLPGSKAIRLLDKSCSRIVFDCFVAVDCADLKRTGSVYKLNQAPKPVLNIDHHISNSYFGDVNWVDPDASSCSEMIYRLHKTLKLAMDQDTAVALYTGIMTDTGSFRYSNTSSFTHLAVAELLKYGVDVVQVYRNAYADIPAREAKLLLKILPGMRFFAGGKVAWFEFRKRLFAGRQPCVDLADMALSFGRAIKGVEVVVLFKENLGSVKDVRVNLRSSGSVDVNKVASFFGGGGHKTASGCTISGSIRQVETKVLRKIKESF